VGRITPNSSEFFVSKLFRVWIRCSRLEANLKFKTSETSVILPRNNMQYFIIKYLKYFSIFEQNVSKNQIFNISFIQMLFFWRELQLLPTFNILSQQKSYVTSSWCCFNFLRLSLHFENKTKTKQKTNTKISLWCGKDIFLVANWSQKRPWKIAYYLGYVNTDLHDNRFASNLFRFWGKTTFCKKHQKSLLYY